MTFFFLFLLLGLFVSLFCLYHISREDFIFMRRNVTLEDMFNMAFLTFFFGFLFARLTYVIFNFAPGFLNPLVFFLVPYYPGLSLIGGIVGGVVSLIYTTRRKKHPTRRILDFIGLSFLAGLPIGYVGSLFISTKLNYFLHLFLPFIFFIVFLIAYIVVYPRLITRELKPGMLGTSVLIVVSFILLTVNIISNLDKKIFFFQPTDSLGFLVFILSLAYFVKQELFILKPKKK